MVVYKYEVPLTDNFELELPAGAKLLSFQSQSGTPVLWALVDSEALKEKRRFRLAGTGHPIEEDAERLVFIGTAQFHSGSLVFHLFEVT